MARAARFPKVSGATLEQVRLNWVKYNHVGLPSDADFDEIVQAQLMFNQLYEIFQPTLSIKADTMRLLDMQDRRRRK